MIKKLQKKFVLITMLALSGVFCVLIGAINIVNYCKNDAEEIKMLNFLSSVEGQFPKFEDNQKPEDNAESENSGSGEEMQHNKQQKPDGIKITPETQYSTRYFMVKTDLDNNITGTKMDNIAAVTEDEAKEYVENIIGNGSEEGFEGVYRYIVVKKKYGNLYVFMDCTERQDRIVSLLIISVAIAFASLVVIFILVSLISKKVTKPFAESYEKQRRFVTDASHEIKTPLAIISADADVLDITIGENEWVAGIKNQTKRLTSLVKNLTTLSKMDEDGLTLTLVPFSLSSAVYDTAAPFSALASAQGKSLSMEIEPDVTLKGDEGSIRELVSILCENAIKYSSEHSAISLALSEKNKDIVLKVSNKCEGMEKSELPRLFDRFYRVDSSRSRETGGSGIGLSIANSIVEMNKGKISASIDSENIITFTAVF